MTTSAIDFHHKQQPSPRFSIVVPVYNNPVDLRNCLTSLKSLNYADDNYEIIVVDNNSTDNTATIPSEFGISCLREVEFQSSYAARNRGIKAARGDFIAFTDSDCVAHPDWLKEIDAATEDESAGCFAGEILSVSPTSVVERFSDRIGLLRQKGPLSGWHFKPYAQTANAVYRKAVFDRVGLFDPTMKSGGDAVIAWSMLDKTNLTIRFVPDAIVYHHHRTNVPDLYAQFKRYGGREVSWSGHWPNYMPPLLSLLEDDVVTELSSHFQQLEMVCASDETLFSALKATTKIAYLLGYLYDRIGTASASQQTQAPASSAGNTSAACNICGSRSFAPGPGGRLPNGVPPQCKNCGSLERHRMLYGFFSTEGKDSSRKTCLTIGEPLRKETQIFHSNHHIDIKHLNADANHYDVVASINLLNKNPSIDIVTALGGLVRRLHDNSTLLLYECLLPQSSGKVAKLGSQVAWHLPNASVHVTHLLDNVTNERGIVVVAHRHPPQADT